LKKGSFPHIAAVIACRVNSTRLFGKPLQLIGKYAILHLLINQIKKSTLIDEIVLAISNEPGNEIFVKFAKERKLKFIIGNEDNVLKRLVTGARNVNADIVFRKTSEDPYIYWEIIDDIITQHVENEFDVSFLDDVPLGCGYEVINRKVLEQLLKSDSKTKSKFWPLEIRRNKKFKIHRYLPKRKFRKTKLRLTVDTPQDLLVARLVHKSLGNKDKPISLKRIINFLDKNPQITKINSKIPLGTSKVQSI